MVVSGSERQIPPGGCQPSTVAQSVGVDLSDVVSVDDAGLLSPSQRRDLKLMERELARAEPGLAAEFARFGPQAR